jgi:hypothetical protein
MRYASFDVTCANGEKAEVSVVMFPGEGGGDLENVNRWRGQIGLPPIEATELKTLTTMVKTSAGDLATVDLTGPKARFLVGWTRQLGNSWFFKLNGSTAAVGSQKETFTQFLQSVQFHP